MSGETYGISPHVRAAGDDDGVILLDLRSGSYLAFNSVAALIWSKIVDGTPRPALVEELREQLDAPSGRIEADVDGFLDELEQKRLIVAGAGISGDDSCPAPEVSPHAQATALPSPGAAPRPARRRGAGEGAPSLLRAVYWSVVSFVALVYVDVLMRGHFGRLYEVLRGCRAGAQSSDAAAGKLICRSMDRAAAVYFKRAWCLQRSAACALLLRRQGIPAELVLGVRTVPFEAHAWVELDGEVINDTPDQVERFLVLDRI